MHKYNIINTSNERNGKSRKVENMAAIKTKKAPVKWDNNNKITCRYEGDKDVFNKAIWYDENGKAYELIYARLAKKYSFNPYPQYNR